MELMEHQLTGAMMCTNDSAALDECIFCKVNNGLEKLAFPVLVNDKISIMTIHAEYPPYVKRLINRYIHSNSWRKKKKQEKALKQTIHGNRFLSIRQQGGKK